MTECYPRYFIHNCLAVAYDALRPLGRFVKGTHVSPYREFFGKVLERSMEGEVPNSEVESYYLKKMSEADFVGVAENRLCGGNGGDSSVMERLLSTLWNTVTADPTHARLCSSHTHQAGRQLWEIFLRLDIGNRKGLHAEDVSDLAVRIFKANNHKEKPEVVMGWFANQECVSFWEFFKIMVEEYQQLLQSPIVAELHKMITTESLKEGKLTKKGHIVPNWKDRWFTLSMSALTYREAKVAPVIKTIVINDKTQVQNMPETRGHLHRFRVLDGSSATPTELSTTDASTLRDWIAYIKLAIKMNQIEGRNFLHKYRLSMGSFPKTFFSPQATAAVPTFTATPQIRNTSPAHKALKSSKSVPLGDANLVNGRGHGTLPATVPEGTDYSDGGDMSDAPPVPPQRFELGVGSEVTGIQRPQTPQGKPNSGGYAMRRRSSLDSYNIEHIQVDGDLEYAVVTKVKKKSTAQQAPAKSPAEDRQPDPPPLKNKSKSTDSPPRVSTPPQPHPRPHATTPPQPRPHATTPPQPRPHATTPPQPRPHATTPSKPSPYAPTPSQPPPKHPPPRRVSSPDAPSITPSRSPRTSPVAPPKGYAELHFDNNSKAMPPNNKTTPTKPPDVANKFGYTQLQFEDSKEKEKEFEKGGVKMKKPLPPVPVHQSGGLSKSTTESSVHAPQSNAAASSHSISRSLPHSKPTSLPDLKAHNKKARNLDYAQVVFNTDSAVSPSISHRILTTPLGSDDHAPRSTAPRVDYATVVLSPPEPKPTVASGNSKPRDSGYENFDFSPNAPKNKTKDSKDVKNRPGYVNIDYSHGTDDGDYENCDEVNLLVNGPKVAGSARLIGGEAPKRKPRAAPRIKTPSTEQAPVPPTRTTSNNTS